MTIDALFIGGSPSTTSRSSALLGHLARQLDAATKSYGPRDFPAEDLLLARTNTPVIAAFLREVGEAKVVVLGTPVYKAVYSGALKLIVDLIAPDALADKVVLGVATAKLDAHGQTVARAYDELFRFFRGSRPLPTLFLLDRQLSVTESGVQLAPDAAPNVDEAIRGLRAGLR